MNPRFSGQNYKFFKVSFVSQFPKETWIHRKHHQPIEVCPESLGAMLEY